MEIALFYGPRCFYSKKIIFIAPYKFQKNHNQSNIKHFIVYMTFLGI